MPIESTTKHLIHHNNISPIPHRYSGFVNTAFMLGLSATRMLSYYLLFYFLYSISISFHEPF